MLGAKLGAQIKAHCISPAIILNSVQMTTQMLVGTQTKQEEPGGVIKVKLHCAIKG